MVRNSVPRGADAAAWSILTPLMGIAIFAPSSWLIYPGISGWFHHPLGDGERVPYRDYYFPVTPLTYWEAQITAGFSNPYLVLRVGALLLAAMFAYGLFSLAHLLVSRRDAFAISTVLVASVAYLRLEPPGGWNTQAVMFTTIGVAFMSHGWVAMVARGPGTRSPVGRSVALGVLAGLFFAFAVLVKQTTLVPIAVASVGFPLFVRLRYGAIWGRSAVRLMLVNGLVVGLAIAWLGAYLVWHGALGAFISDMSSGGGKNVRLTKVAQDLVTGLDKNVLNLGVLVVALSTVVLLLWLRRAQRSGDASQLAAILGCATGLLTFLSLRLLTIRPALSYPVVFLIAILSGLCCYLRSRRLIGQPAEWKLSRTIFLLVLVIPLLTGMTVDYATHAFSSIGQFLLDHIFNLLLIPQVLLSAAVTGTLLLGPAVAGRRWWERTSGLVPADSGLPEQGAGVRQREAVIAIAILVAVGSILTGVAASGGTFFLLWFIPSMSVLLAVLVSWARRRAYLRIFVPTLVGFLYVCAAVLLVTVVLSPYLWWGWREPSLLATPRAAVNYGYVRNVALAPSSGQFFDRIRAAELEAGARSGKAGQARPTVFSFPNLTSTESLTDLPPYTRLPCATLWFDLCPNELARRSLKIFAASPPDIVVWADPGKDAFTIHETLFLGEPSALREWIAYRDARVADRSWVPVDEIPADATSSNLWTTTIFHVVK